MSIEVRGISQDVRRLRRAERRQLHRADGELLALLGPSGSGKTTLLRIIAGLEVADRGHRAVRRRGRDASGSRASGSVGFVFQHYALFRHMTVFENVAFGLRVRPGRQPAVRRRDSPEGPRAARAGAAGRPRRSRSPVSSPAGSGSAWRWRGPWRSSRRCCCSTSRSARSTPRCGRSCGSGCAGCTTRSMSPASSSPTTRRRRSRSPTAWW